jgi:hypothetical protein
MTRNLPTLIAATCLLLLGVRPAPAQEGPELILGTFDRPEDARLWEGSGSGTATFEPRDPTDLNKMCKVVLGAGGYGGIYSYRQPKDWSPYEVLSFVVWSPDRRGLGIRVDDENSKNYATRYNGDVTLEAGRNLVQIPLREMKAVINPAKVKSMGLFVTDPPKGLVLYFDDIRLGARQTDKVSFIPYDKRLEYVPTTDVASPHFPLARPLAGGPLKALVLYDIEEGRDLTELMQRLSLKVSPVTWSTETGVQKWNGIAYGQRSYDLSRRYLASTAQGPEPFDTMILATPTGWGPLGKAATDPILDRVKNRGEGLVLVFPYPGEKPDARWPEDLKSISALIDSETDFQRDNGYIRPALNGHNSGKKWRAVKDHPITRGVPLDALPFEALDVQTYKLAPGAEVLIETETGVPVLAVREVGKARVVTFATRSRSITPYIPNAGARRQWRDYRYWEVFYDLLARAAIWSARRELTQTGPGAVTAADSALSLRQWKNPKGEVTDWKVEYTAPTRTAIKVTASDVVARGADIEVKFEPVAGAKHVARLIDYAGGRRRTLAERPVDGAFSWSTKGFESLALVTEVEAGTGLGEATTYVTPDASWSDYEVYGWSAGGISYLRDLQMSQLRGYGLTTEQVGGVDEARESFRRGFRVHAMFSDTGLHVRDFDRVFREFNMKPDPKLLVRNPSFSDASFLDGQRTKISRWAKSMAPYSPLTMSLGDETSLTSYQAEFDFDYHPENIRAFRERLKSQFVDVAAMKKAIGVEVKAFDDVVPPTTAEARKSGNWGLWSEWRNHNDELWTGAFRFYRDEMRKEYAPTRLSVSGTQVSHVFNGIDWSRLAPVMGAIADYTGRFQLIERMCFNPEIKSTPWAGYGRTGPGAAHQLWQNLSFDGSGTAFFWYPSLLNADYTLSESSRDYYPTLKLLREGLGKEFLQTRRRYAPVAILWSARSQRAAWTAGKLGEFEKAEAEVYRSLVEAGYDPSFVSEDAIPGGLRALVLPMTVSMSPALEKWKGVMLATQPATMDEYLQPRPASTRALAFPSTAEELAKALGFAPEASALAADGKRMPAVVVSVHAFPGSAEGALLCVLRDPVGQSEMVGADGVVHLVADPKGGKPVETGFVDVSRFAGKRFFDVIHRREVVAEGGKLKLELPAGQAVVVAALPYGPLAMSAEVTRKGDRLQVGVTAKVQVPHVLRLSVVDKATGLEDTLLSRNLLLGKEGRVDADLALSLEDRPRILEVRVVDVLTGSTETK